MRVIKPLFVVGLGSMVVSIGFPVIMNRMRKSRELRNALHRIRNADNAGIIITRNQMLFLAKVKELSRHMTDLDTLMRTRGTNPQDIRSKLKEITDMLAPYRQRSETPDSFDGGAGQIGDPEWDPIASLLPPRNKPSFFHAFSFAPSFDPNDWLSGIDRDGEAEPGTTHSEGRYSDGGRWEEDQTIGEDGSRTIVSREYDSKNSLVGTHTYIIRPDGSATSRWDHHSGGLSTRTEHDYDADERPTARRDYWREGNDNGWRPGRPLDDINRYPKDEATSRDRTYFIRLANGGYARCVILNPSSGFGHCTVLSEDLVNMRFGSEPILNGERLVINSYDLVVNPPIDRPLPHMGTPTPIPREVGPGQRPPDPPV